MVTGLPPDIIGTAAPRAIGWRPNITLIGATKMCRCLECTTITRNTSMTPMCSSRPMPSRTSSVW